ncbi:MAG: hypothetical protein KAI29_07660, partial [Cyclobacteriaceae bacterium]|nr:hypothetical protein [Cyclobacteriaceae bacterium]
MNKLYHLVFDKIKQSFGKLFNVVLFKIHPAFIFSALLLITIFLVSFLPSLKFNYDIESFFSSQDPEVEFYYNHKDTFENENDFVMVGIKNDSGIFQNDFLEKLETLSKGLKRVPGVKKVFSPTNLYEAIKTPMGSIRIPLLHVDDPDKYASDKNRIYTAGNYTNSFFSPDVQSVSLLIKKEEELSRQANDSLLLALNTAITTFGFDEYHIAGRIRTQQYYVTQMQKQMILFGALACILFLGSLFLIFKCIRYVLLSLGAVVLS